MLINSFLLHLLFALLLHPALVYGQGSTAKGSTATWGLGMDLRLFVAKDDTVTTCPPSVRAAETNGGIFPIWQNDGKIITTKPALSVPGRKTSLSFRLVNGWVGAKGKFDSNSQTLVQASEPASTGGGCWVSGAGGEIDARGCGADRLSQFYLDTEVYGGGGMHIMYNADIAQVKNDGQKGQLVANTGVVKANICVYETKSGLPVVAPAQNYHFPTSEITTLIGQTIPPASKPTREENLPGCKTGSGMDCLIARAINGYPKECSGNPFTMKCVLFLAPAFCFDVPGRRLKQPAVAETQVEFCLRNVAGGPCLANPGGAACASGMFPGIAQWVSGGGSVSKRGLDQPGYGALVKRAYHDPLFGDQPNNLPLLDQFYVGMMKNLINAAISIWNLLREGLVYSSRMNCYGMTVRLKGNPQELNKIREGCADFFQPKEPVKTLPLFGEIEEAGDIFADVVSILFAVGDLAKALEAPKYIGKMGEIISKFVPRSYGKGKILEAKSPSGETIQIFNDYGDRRPETFFTDQGVNDVKETTEQYGFRNCRNCKGLVRRGGGLSKLLCCVARPRHEAVLESAEEMSEIDVEFFRTNGRAMTRIDEAAPVAQRSIAKTVPIAKDSVGLRVLADGSKQYRSYYLGERPPPPTLDPVNQVFYEKVNELYAEMARNPRHYEPWKEELYGALARTYGITEEDANSVHIWASVEHAFPGLDEALAKLNPVKSWTISTQRCSDEMVKMLKAGAPGPSSKGPPGVYSVRDITTYIVQGMREDEAVGLSTSIGMFPLFQTSTTPYRFCILSESGRYLPPFNANFWHEVLFHERLAGKFKLLGYEELNGGEAAKAAGGPPPYGVFYFQEIDAPPFTPHQVRPPVINFPR